MKIARMGLDIAKAVFQVHGVNQHEAVKARKTLARAKVLEDLAQPPPCLDRARGVRHGTAHYWHASWPSAGMR